MDKSCKIGLIIYCICLVLVTIDAFTTNWMYSQLLPEFRDSFELNPLMKSIIGTGWLYVIKIGWVILFGLLILTVKDRRLNFNKRNKA